VGVRGGVAVGLLGLIAFDQVRRLVIEPWADAGFPHQRQAVVAALQLPGATSELAALVDRMIADWLHPTQPLARRETAVAALGTLGMRAPSRTLRRLRNAVLSTGPLEPHAAAALTQLFLEPTMRQPILEALLRWSFSTSRAVRRTAVLATLRIADEVHAEPMEAAEQWPALVVLADHDESRKGIVDLLAALLDAPNAGRRTLRILRRWIWLAGRDPAFLAPLAQLFGDLQELGSSRVLRAELATWRTERGAPLAEIDLLDHQLDPRPHVMETEL
jgi:hypothetical protein